MGESEFPKDSLSDEKTIPLPDVAQQSNQCVDYMGIVFFPYMLFDEGEIPLSDVAQQANQRFEYEGFRPRQARSS